MTQLISKRARNLLFPALLSLGALTTPWIVSADALPGRGNDNIVVRTAVFDGVVAAEHQDAFRKEMQTLESIVVKYPGIKDVRVRYLSDKAEAEKDAPHPYVTFDFYFNTVDDMNKALDTPLRNEAREQVQKSLLLFNGKIYHFVRDESGVTSK